MTYLVQYNRCRGWPRHLLLNVRDQRADLVVPVDKDFALTSQGLLDKVKVFEEDHDGGVVGVGVQSLESSDIGIVVKV